MKSLFADQQFNKKHRLGAVNSINWARILAQTVYYFLSYFHLRKQIAASAPSQSLDDVEIQYVVPTGNFGDILAGYYAKRMGLPIGKLVVATNSNDILARFWKSGTYEKVDSQPSGNNATAPAEGASDGKPAVGGVKETLSPAMDILVSSNFERLLYYLAEEGLESTSHDPTERRRQACAALDGWMKKVKSDGRVEVPTKVLELARRDFLAERVSDQQVTTNITFFKDASLTSEIPDPRNHQILFQGRTFVCC